jgi:hypothetical protein
MINQHRVCTGAKNVSTHNATKIGICNHGKCKVQANRNADTKIDNSVEEWHRIVPGFSLDGKYLQISIMQHALHSDDM